MNFRKSNIFIQKQPQKVLCEKRCSGNFGKFTGKHLCQDLFLNKVTGLSCNFIKKETLTQTFSCGFCEIFESTFFTEPLCATVSVNSLQLYWNELLNTYLSKLLKLTVSSKIVMDGYFYRDGQVYVHCRYFVSQNDHDPSKRFLFLAALAVTHQFVWIYFGHWYLFRSSTPEVFLS